MSEESVKRTEKREKRGGGRRILMRKRSESSRMRRMESEDGVPRLRLLPRSASQHSSHPISRPSFNPTTSTSIPSSQASCHTHPSPSACHCPLCHRLQVVNDVPLPSPPTAGILRCPLPPSALSARPLFLPSISVNPSCALHRCFVPAVSALQKFGPVMGEALRQSFEAPLSATLTAKTK